MAFDLQKYFQRIGYQGPQDNSVATLHAITQAHTQTIPFENIDILLGRNIRIGAESIFTKLVSKQRGGYCFEQNNLLLQVLKRLGFTAQALGGRVRLRYPDRDIYPARTHLFLHVEAEGEHWITDVGFGAMSLTQALQWQPDLVQQTPHGERRVTQFGDRWFQQAKGDDGWFDVYEFSAKPMVESDQQIANWFTSTHPSSNFTQSLNLAIAKPHGQRVTMAGNVLKLRDADGASRRYRIGKGAFREVLESHFGIYLSNAELHTLWMNNVLKD